MLLVLFFIGLSIGLWVQTGGANPLMPLLLLTEVTLALALVFLLVLARSQRALPPLSPEAEVIRHRLSTEPDYSLRAGVADLLRLDQKLEAILVYRQVTGAGPGQAREAVEIIERELGR